MQREVPSQATPPEGCGLRTRLGAEGGSFPGHTSWGVWPGYEGG